MKEIIKTFPKSDDPLRISMAGISYCDGNYRIKRARSTVTVIEYVLKGTGYVKLQGEFKEVYSDTIYILPKGEEHEYYSSSSDPLEKIFINISGDFAISVLEQYKIYDAIIHDASDTKNVFLEISKIVKNEKNEECEDCRIEALFLEIVSRLNRRYGRAAHNTEAIIMKDFLDQNTHRIISNQELSSLIYRSSDYCIKLFRAEYGKTPYDYHINEKMQIAKRLLRDTAIPVSEIAARLGYNDLCYFSGLFKNKCGMSPRNYRKKNLR